MKLIEIKYSLSFSILIFVVVLSKLEIFTFTFVKLGFKFKSLFILFQESAAGSLVMKLQLMISKLNTALEDQCHNVVQSIPR